MCNPLSSFREMVSCTFRMSRSLTRQLLQAIKSNCAL